MPTRVRPESRSEQWGWGSPRACDICGVLDCAPIEHADDLLSDEHALHYARKILEDGSMNPREKMLARWIISRLDLEPKQE